MGVVNETPPGVETADGTNWLVGILVGVIVAVRVKDGSGVGVAVIEAVTEGDGVFVTVEDIVGVKGRVKFRKRAID